MERTKDQFNVESQDFKTVWKNGPNKPEQCMRLVSPPGGVFNCHYETHFSACVNTLSFHIIYFILPDVYGFWTVGGNCQSVSQ